MDIEEKNCSSCEDRNSCKDIYQKLGRSDAPPITTKVILAFVLPMLVFIASLFVFERITAGFTDSKELAILVGFFAALFITAAFCFAVKAVRKHKKQ